mmetsp:Transcript_34054/g.62321  ORF Transcript_34054/g.62321 Transcript_34054/m.62321 type:complete len:217 (+) Transcript_34054:96-746(+)
MGLGQSQCCSTGRREPGWCGSAKGVASRDRQDLVGIAPTQPPGVKHVPSTGFANEEDGKHNGQSNGNGNAVSPVTKDYPDGSVYTGHLVAGLRHGQGVYRCGTYTYEGQWEDDLHHGVGVQAWGDGRTYRGGFEQGKFSGKGHMVWQLKKGQLTYEGEYKGDLKHGKGKFTWADGRVYDGEWRNGKRHGQGVYINSDQEAKTGLWKEDQFEGWVAE